MAKTGVTGWTQEKIDRKFEKWRRSREELEESYCLAKIPHQPEDYDGPKRYCMSDNTFETGSNNLCKHHGGARSNDWNTENLTPIGNMKHGMKATQENLVKGFTEKDEALYNWVVEEFPEAYDIDVHADPQAEYDLHRLGVEIVRAERGRGYLIDEGEVREEAVKDDEGAVVVDESGEIVTEKSEHYLADMLYQQDNKITKLERTLGISRKERLNRDTRENAAEAVAKGFSELGGAFLNRDETDYDPDSKPWEGDDAD